MSYCVYLLHDVAQVDVLHSGDIYWLDAGDTEPQLLVPTIYMHRHVC